MNPFCPSSLKQQLHQRLTVLEDYSVCAFLDYPDHLNLGDLLIGLGSMIYLIEVLKIKIGYIASLKSFSEEQMEKQVGKVPIFLHGGGNLGDIWPVHQKFRESIISKYKDRPIVILPQSIYFKNQDNLQETAKIFNAHPNLTIFVRDAYSYDIAIKSFTNCRVIQSPDMAFQLIESPQLSSSSINPQKLDSILYLNRKDREVNKSFNLDKKAIHEITNLNLVEGDWVSFDNHWLLGTEQPSWLQLLINLYREGWQRGLTTPHEWLSRSSYLSSHPYSQMLRQLPNFQLPYRSLSFIYSGMYQFRKYPLIITNRLHGHILSIILEIPHVFLPNSYYKNQSFYQAWTSEVPFCRFVENPNQFSSILSSLLNNQI